MEIKKAGNDSFIINSKHANILVYPNDKTKGADVNIVLGHGKDDSIDIVSPGEYESHEAWILGFNTDSNEVVNNVYVVSADGINIGVLQGDVSKLSKYQLDKIGLIDVLIVQNGEKFDAAAKDLVSEIDPQILITSGYSDEEITKLASNVGVKNIEEEKKLKLKMEDFQNEDYQLKIVKL